ncbi:MAG: hypothetical protein JEZ08_04490 [Clostridiales bacterium]|nr:hypothetical protein [Clostridiales bacterium]
MGLHQQNEEMLSDDHFLEGEIKYLEVGNKCRLLDGRRTPGVIQSLDYVSGHFRWEIMDFEDKGKTWDVRFESVENYQFEKDVIINGDIDKIETIISKLNKKISVPRAMDKVEDTEKKIEILMDSTNQWIQNKSKFICKMTELDRKDSTQLEQISHDFLGYMESLELLALETKTSELMVLNPNSGEWIKGLMIVMAELGLASYDGNMARSEHLFTGMGDKAIREKYILQRMAFIRCLFNRFNKSEITLFRGMSSEGTWFIPKRTFLSMTFDPEVASAFSDFEEDSRYKTSYMIKSSVDIKQIFMTYIETKEMNERYKEKEAIIYDTGNMSI